MRLLNSCLETCAEAIASNTLDRPVRYFASSTYHFGTSPSVRVSTISGSRVPEIDWKPAFEPWSPAGNPGCSKSSMLRPTCIYHYRFPFLRTHFTGLQDASAEEASARTGRFVAVTLRTPGSDKRLLDPVSCSPDTLGLLEAYPSGAIAMFLTMWMVNRFGFRSRSANEERDGS